MCTWARLGHYLQQCYILIKERFILYYMFWIIILCHLLISFEGDHRVFCEINKDSAINCMFHGNTVIQANICLFSVLFHGCRHGLKSNRNKSTKIQLLLSLPMPTACRHTLENSVNKLREEQGIVCPTCNLWKKFWPDLLNLPQKRKWNLKTVHFCY